jgi:hypothetical protein
MARSRAGGQGARSIETGRFVLFPDCRGRVERREDAEPMTAATAMPKRGKPMISHLCSAIDCVPYAV